MKPATTTTTATTRMEKQVTEEEEEEEGDHHQQQQQQSMTLTPTTTTTTTTATTVLLTLPPPPTLVYGRIILGEVTPLLAAIKRTGAQRWSSHSQGDAGSDHLTTALTRLQQTLLTLTPSSAPLPPLEYLEPFLAVVKAEETSGPVTRDALSAVNRMVGYGLLNPRDSSAGSLRESAVAAEAVAAAVSRARFIGTESAADEVVLFSIVYVLSAVVLSAAGPLLSNAAVCEILNSAFRICFENRLSDLLRACTEEALRQMVTLIFTRLPFYPPHDSPAAPQATPGHPKVKLRSAKGHSKSDPQATSGNRETRSRSKGSNSTVVKVGSRKSAEENVDYGVRSDVRSDVRSGVRSPTSAATPTESHASAPNLTNAHNLASDESDTSRVSDVPSGAHNADLQGEVRSGGGPDMHTSAEGAGVLAGMEGRPISDMEAEKEAVNDAEADIKISEGGSDVGVKHTGDVTQSDPHGGIISTQTDAKGPQKTPSEAGDQYINSQGVKFTTNNDAFILANPNAGYDPTLQPFGVPCVRELLRFLISLTTPLNDQNTTRMIQTALNLLTVALEIGSDTIPGIPSLMSLISDHLTKHLLQILRHLDLHRSYGVYMSALRLSALLIESFRTHLKYQVECIHNTLLDLITSERVEVTYAHKEYAIRTLISVWCVEAFPVELYMNFDCDIYSANCLEESVKSLSKQVFPLQGIYANNLLCLDALLLLMESLDSNATNTEVKGRIDDEVRRNRSKMAVVESGNIKKTQGQILKKPEANFVSSASVYPQAPRLIARTQLRDDRQTDTQALLRQKKQKNLIAAATDLFNTKPEKGIAYLIEHGILGRKTDELTQTGGHTGKIKGLADAPGKKPDDEAQAEFNTGKITSQTDGPGQPTAILTQAESQQNIGSLTDGPGQPTAILTQAESQQSIASLTDGSGQPTEIQDHTESQKRNIASLADGPRQKMEILGQTEIDNGKFASVTDGKRQKPEILGYSETEHGQIARQTDKPGLKTENTGQTNLQKQTITGETDAQTVLLDPASKKTEILGQTEVEHANIASVPDSQTQILDQGLGSETEISEALTHPGTDNSIRIELSNLPSWTTETHTGKDDVLKATDTTTDLSHQLTNTTDTQAHSQTSTAENELIQTSTETNMDYSDQANNRTEPHTHTQALTTENYAAHMSTEPRTEPYHQPTDRTASDVTAPTRTTENQVQQYPMDYQTDESQAVQGEETLEAHSGDNRAFNSEMLADDIARTLAQNQNIAKLKPLDETQHESLKCTETITETSEMDARMDHSYRTGDGLARDSLTSAQITRSLEERNQVERAGLQDDRIETEGRNEVGSPTTHSTSDRIAEKALTSPQSTRKAEKRTEVQIADRRMAPEQNDLSTTTPHHSSDKSSKQSLPEPQTALKPGKLNQAHAEVDEIALFLRQNPKLCKKALGNYLSAKKNVEILNAFVRTFDFKNLRVDEALRMFLETFRLPGEAPLISLVLETFASHWFDSNSNRTVSQSEPSPGDTGNITEATDLNRTASEDSTNVTGADNTSPTPDKATSVPATPHGTPATSDSSVETSVTSDLNLEPPVRSSDAAFTLAYAVIMLNVDQHNKNAKKQNTPMTFEQFRANLRGVNDGVNFESSMLGKIYDAVKSEEFVMPSEQTGAVKDEYDWKLLLKRSETDPLGYLLANGSTEFNRDLFLTSWGPTVAALSYVYDKSADEATIHNALAGYKRIASIAYRFNMADVFDNLIVTLCKFTTLNYPQTTDSEAISAAFSGSLKARLSARCVFDLIVSYGDAVRDGWRNIVEIIVRLYRARLLPKSLTDAKDFLSASGKVSLQPAPPIPTPLRSENSLLSSLYSYIAMGDTTQTRTQHQDTETVMCARSCVRECRPERVIHESVYLRTHTLIEFMRTLLSDAYMDITSEDAHTQAFLLELCVRVLTCNKDRAHVLWPHVRKNVHTAFLCARKLERVYLLERTCVCILRCTQVLLRRPADGWSQTVRWLLSIKPKMVHKVAPQILLGLKEILTANTVHIQSEDEWDLIFALVEFVGAGAAPPLHCLEGGAGGEETGGESDGTIDSGVGSDELPQLPPSEDPSYSGSYSGSSSSRGAYNSQLPSPTSPQLPPQPALDSGSGGWILVGREGEVEQTQQPSQNHQLPPITTTTTTTTAATTTTTTTPYTLVPPTPPRFKHRPKNLLTAVATLSFLAKDCLPVTGAPNINYNSTTATTVRSLAATVGHPDSTTTATTTAAGTPAGTILALGSATRAARTLVEASLHGGLINQQLSSKQSNHNYQHSKKKKKKKKKTSATTTTAATTTATSTSSEGEDDDDDNSGSGGGSDSSSCAPNTANNYNLIYQQVSEKLLDLMGCLHTSASQLSTYYQQPAATTTTTTTATVDLWNIALCPLLQGIARLCCDCRGSVRSLALTTLQRALLTHDLVLLTAARWEELFHRVLFPLLNGLIELPLLLQLPQQPQQLLPQQQLQLQQLEEARLRAATLVMKVYLRHLSPLLTLPTFTALWLTILDFLDKYLSVSNDHLREAIPEMLKNMLLVMQTTQVFQTEEGFTQLWCITWDRIDAFLPSLRHNIFRSHPPSEIQSPEPAILTSTATTTPTTTTSAITAREEDKEEEEEPKERFIPPTLREQQAARLSLSQENLPEIIEHSGVILQPPLPAPQLASPVGQSQSGLGQNGRGLTTGLGQTAVPLILQGLPLYLDKKE